MKNRAPAKDYGEELSEKRRRRRARVFIICLSAFFISAAGGTIYVFFFTDWLFFREVRVEGAVAVNREELIPGGPLRLYSKINVSDPRISAFEVERDYFKRELVVRITERKPYAVWCSEKTESGGDENATGTRVVSADCYWFDGDGFVFVKAPDTEGALLRSVLDASGRNIGVGEYVLPEDMRRVLFRVFDMLTNSGVAVLRYRVEPFEKEEVTAFTAPGAELYFSLRVNPEFAAEPLKLLLPDLDSLKYIDFRSENKVFYK